MIPAVGSRWVDELGERWSVAGTSEQLCTIASEDGRSKTIGVRAFGMELRPVGELPGQTDIFGGVA
jgi:hypothetical protein